MAVIDWEINLGCNLKCDYCYLLHKLNAEPLQRIDSKKVLANLDKTGKSWLLHMSGGEPFLTPGFAVLCKALAEKHRLSINTNLSLSVAEFAAKVNPNRVEFVHCSLHYGFRADVEGFISRVKQLKNAGFRVVCSQVMHPAVIDNYPKLVERFAQAKLSLLPKLFQGEHKGRVYPAAYSDADRKLIAEHAESTVGHINIALDLVLFEGMLSFKGRMCAAGSDFVFVNSKGFAFRCNTIKEPLGNLYNEGLLLSQPKPCPAEVCYCHYYGLRFAEGDYKIKKGW
jgi:MoaA/NifB/PqqE/SkfB family radical SAM enzyme